MGQGYQRMGKTGKQENKKDRPEFQGGRKLADDLPPE
jgi:hypothetical protein